ncbi:unnamed protein product [Rotaria socialis]|uniref:Transposase Tc1-like domain-containing protein n=1 Tax=Rotaria socialis TaxID=392032 RepID=A0A821HJH2_9BILA|nr:unnamed protein product [Rotaria socialis]
MPTHNHPQEQYIKNQGTIEDRSRKITENDDKALGQWIRRNNETKLQELVQNLLHDRDLNVSRWTVQRQLKRMGYKSTLPYGTLMLTQKHNEARVQWAIQHKDDRLSFIQNNYERSFLCSNSSRSSYPQCQEAISLTMAIAAS